MQEITAIIEKYDIGAMVVIHRPGFVEYKLAPSPSYSVAKFEGEKLMVKAKLDDYQGNIAEWTRDVSNTMNLLQLLAEVGGQMSCNLFELIDELKKKVKIENDRGDHTSHIEQNN